MEKPVQHPRAEPLETGEGGRGYCFEELAIGLSVATTHTVTEADIAAFAAVSGDTNPVHLDAEFAATTPFGGRIAHGLLAASYISAIFGTRLPGPGCIYVAQSLRFKAPVRPGDTVVARVTVTALNEVKKRATFNTVCFVADKVVLDGEAEIMVPGRA